MLRETIAHGGRAGERARLLREAVPLQHERPRRPRRAPRSVLRRRVRLAGLPRREVRPHEPRVRRDVRPQRHRLPERLRRRVRVLDLQGQVARDEVARGVALVQLGALLGEGERPHGVPLRLPVERRRRPGLRAARVGLEELHRDAVEVYQAACGRGHCGVGVHSGHPERISL